MTIFILYRAVVHVRLCRRRHEQLSSAHIYTTYTHVRNVVRCYLSWRLDSVAMIQWFDIWSGCKRSSRFEHNNTRCNHITLDWKLWFNQSLCMSMISLALFKNVAISSYNKKMWIENFDSEFRKNYDRIHFSWIAVFEKFNFIQVHSP